MTRRRILLIFVTLIAVAFTSGSCRKIKSKLGITETVVEPADGSPEKVLQDAMKAALTDKEDAGWRKFRKLLHTDERSQRALAEWRQLRFASFRRKVKLYVRDAEKVSYEIVRVDERPNGSLKYFIENTGNPDNPTPCTLIKDMAADGAWRIRSCSL